MSPSAFAEPKSGTCATLSPSRILLSLFRRVVPASTSPQEHRASHLSSVTGSLGVEAIDVSITEINVMQESLLDRPGASIQQSTACASIPFSSPNSSCHQTLPSSAAPRDQPMEDQLNSAGAVGSSFHGQSETSTAPAPTPRMTSSSSAASPPPPAFPSLRQPSDVSQQPEANSRDARSVATRNYVIGGLSFDVDARYAIKSIVGKGAYGLVCAAEDLCPSPHGSDDGSGLSSPRESGAPPPPKAASSAIPAMVAVKKVIDPFYDHTDCKRLLREIRFLRCLRHPNVLHLTDILPPPGRSPSVESWKDVYLVTRLFETNLHRVIYSGHALTDAHIQYILWQIFRALRYLHAAGVVHRDMKPTNLLLNRDCELALADFGLARYIPQRADVASEDAGEGPNALSGHVHHRVDASTPDATQASSSSSSSLTSKSSKSTTSKNKLTKYVVTRWYRAPELLVQNKQYDSKVDLWSTGCLVAELLGARAIFPGNDSLHQLRLIIERLGVPSEDELDFIQNPQAITYIRNLRPKQPHPRSPTEQFAALYPNANPLLLDLMASLLHFDPRQRPTAAEALAHPYLSAYREAPEEGLPTPEVEMAFEHEDPSTDELRMLIWQEVLRYHPNGSPHGSPHDLPSCDSQPPINVGSGPEHRSCGGVAAGVGTDVSFVDL